MSELYEDVVEKLKGLIQPAVLNSYGDKILFAICIHTIECWLLPLYYTNNHKSDTRTCINTLNVALKKHNINPLPINTKDKNNPKSRKTYGAILKNLKNKKQIIITAEHNEAFKIFVDSLSLIEKSF